MQVVNGLKFKEAYIYSLHQMKFNFQYIQEFSVATKETGPQLVQKLETTVKELVLANDRLSWVKRPGLLDLLSGRGRITIRIREEDKGSVLEVKLVPLLFDFGNALYFTLFSLATWAVIFLLFPFNVFFLLGLLVEWIIIVLAAPYILVLLLLAFTLLLAIDPGRMPISFLVFAWVATALVLLLTLAYNRTELRKYFFSTLQKAGIQAYRIERKYN
jgi:hypothetical protein